MKRILFVDDEQPILDGLRTLLRKYRKKWDMDFALGGEEALEKLAESETDVIVTDMRMPKMDGAALLAVVLEKYPQVVRIVLSGHSEMEATLRSVPVAHQFLNKPCESELLENVVERACNLQSLVGDKLVRKIIGRIERLPSLPSIYMELTRALSNDDTSASDIAKIIQRDMALSAKILQLVNSSFFRTARTISTVEHAVAYLGSTAVKSLVLSAEVFRSDMKIPSELGFSVQSLQRHAMAAATLAARLITEIDPRRKNTLMADDAYVTGLLHDIGKLVLAAEIPEHLMKASKLAARRRISTHSAEIQIAGISHAEVGAYLLGLWGLPYSIVEAVANHHMPSRVSQKSFDILAGVAVADALLYEIEAPKENEMDPPVALDLEYLSGLGVADRLEGWRELAAEINTEEAA